MTEDLKVTINLRTNRKIRRADIRTALSHLNLIIDSEFVQVMSVNIAPIVTEPEPEPIVIANEDCIQRIANFGPRMAALLTEFGLELVVDPGMPKGVLSINDCRRPDNANYSAVAFCSGYSSFGPFTMASNRQVSGVELADVSPSDPENYAELKAAKIAGNDW